MTLKDVLTPEKLFYSQMFQEDFDGLVLNDSFDNVTMINNEKNFEKFLQDKYYKPLTNIINGNIKEVISPMLSYEIIQKRGIHIKFSIDYFFIILLGTFYDDESIKDDFFSLKYEDRIAFVKQRLRDFRNHGKDILRNGNKSKYYESSSKNRFYTEKLIDYITTILVNMNYIVDFFEKDINIKEFFEAFDYDKFCLLMACTILENLYKNTSNKIDPSIQYLMVYFDAIKIIRSEDQTYNPKLICRNKQKRIISLDDVMKQYELFIKKYPESQLFRYSNFNGLKEYFHMQGVSEEDMKDFNTFLAQNKPLVLDYIDKLKAERDLLAEWEFIPKGNREKDSIIDDTNVSEKTIPSNEIARRKMIANNYLESTNYIYRLVGLNKFQGYIGYVYQNGKVIFSQVYDDLSDKKASSTAIYVMNYQNFVDLSRCSKTEIIHIINNDPSADVKRIFHYKDMKKTIHQINRVINDGDYNENIISHINNLILSKKIRKNGDVK